MSSAILEPGRTAYCGAGTFLPGDSSQKLDDLLDAVWRNRLTTFLVVHAELFSLCPADCDASGFLAASYDVINLEEGARRVLINQPIFQVWIGLMMRDLNARLTGKIDDPQPLRNRLNGFSAMRDRACEMVSKASRPSFHRLDMDPLIATVLPPSYEVPDDPDERKARSQVGHPLGFFRDVALIALDRIQATWPAVREYFEQLVYNVCYLPDGNFRSCSASRYPGVILISNRDRSILDLEESLVHEAGHQLLYQIVEAHAISDDDVKDQYRLPWSGQIRDFYGYFHAFYIYVLLAQYHERAMEQRSGPDADIATERLRDILRGLVMAMPDFQANPHLTPPGHALVTAVAKDVHDLEARRRSLLVS